MHHVKEHILKSLVVPEMKLKETLMLKTNKKFLGMIVANCNNSVNLSKNVISDLVADCTMPT